MNIATAFAPAAPPRLTAAAPPSTEARVTQDRADLLYAYGIGGLAISATASAFLVWMVATPAAWPLLKLWLAAMAGLLVLRAIDMAVLHPRRRMNGVGGAVDIGCFATGVIACGCVWAAFPVLFFPSLGIAARCGAGVILAAMAGGSVTVLGPCLPLAGLACTAMLLPPAVMFLILPGREAHFLGVLGLAMLAMMLASSRTANRSIVTALRLSRVNQNLMAEADRQRGNVEAVNQQLKIAQIALNEANHSLERRIVARTADLEREIGERKHYAEALARLASTDPLTGLCNRINFAERLACMLATAERAGSFCAVLFLDLDNFKQINDVRGHATGDHVLQAVSRLLNERAGGVGELARWGGDEFVVALPVDPGSATAMTLGQDLRRVLAQPLQAGLETVRVGATIGIALFPEHGRTQDELIRAADVAMYQAKREGRGRVTLFDSALADGLAERHMLEQALRTAIERSELSLVFQPIVSARTGRCEALEALVRWTHPERGLIGPADFIPVAEQSGQIAAIGRFVLREACRAAAGWPGRAGQDKPPAVTVNVSVAQVLSGTLIADVESALRETGLPPARLQLEITESMFVGDHVRVTPVFEELRRRGHRILLDDFGTGFSSLAYLGKLPLDVIKIDQSFVRGAERDGFAIINAILSIARALSLEVTAEGVETPLQKTVLASIGVERLQGYLISRPMQNDAVPAWLAANGHGMKLLPRAAVA
jgi:diguanylate cyclase (GGDEF)-like protein